MRGEDDKCICMVPALRTQYIPKIAGGHSHNDTTSSNQVDLSPVSHLRRYTEYFVDNASTEDDENRRSRH